MSIIISVFVFAYLAAIVLASILGFVWLVSLFSSVMRKVFAERFQLPRAVGAHMLSH